ncbi:DUF2608 domain-containing protein [Aestuariibacter sp. GS-14]|uniref:DUF2608 domain-containing protein n=1 Tax=Aestuariibacter sp. GS-14 TaxID=2590670 RepID=UPI001126F993|nr:DUF2608 domain-containing protein [Aestuariibacter sp. GS-14]TPV57261.1 DUF2608 domain-containing protein [Aestuariibacter sp. GS-14]
MASVFKTIYANRLATVMLACAAISLTACAAAPVPLKAGAYVEEVVSFNQIAPVVEALNQRYQPENVLIVSDIDNTLLTNNGGLGGDIWYQWQRGKLPVKPSPEQSVSCLFEDVIGMLYELSPMALTEPQVPALITEWQSAGNPLMLLTSRSPDYRSPTERELLNKGINTRISALLPKDGSNPEYREKLEREMSYSRGIMMTTGMHKGKMLEWILNKTGREFAAIVFIDDSQHNIDDMFGSWQNKPVEMAIFHYTQVETKRIEKFGQVLNTEQADALANDYVALSQTLKSVFPKRYESGRCLSTQ